MLLSIAALASLAGDAQGATVYVTLEPCCTTGRTAPCTDALIAAGVARVISATEDPNPAVAGNGHAALRAAGIAVAQGLMADASRALNRGYWRRIAGQLPWVRIKLASSLDGRTAMASGESQWITAAPAREAVQQLRAQSCALITGIGTVQADNPRLNVRLENIVRQPALVIVDAQLECQPESWVLSAESTASRDVYLATLPSVNEAKRQQLEQQGVNILELPAEPGNSGRIDLQQLLLALARLSFNELMVEAGNQLAGAFVRAQLCDELYLFVAARLMGKTGKPLLDLSIDTMADAVDLAIDDVRAVGDDWLLVARPQYQP